MNYFSTHITKQSALACLFFLILAAPALSMNPQYTPDNTQFAFDFHDVVVKAQPGRVWALLSKEAIPSLNRHLFQLIWHMAQSAWQGSSGEEYITLLRTYGQPTLANLATKIANDQQPIPGTIALIKMLKAKGYETNMASDIGTTILKDMEENWEHKSIFTLFDHIQSVNYLTKNPPIKKPSAAFFKAYLNNYNTDGKKVIFIDDKLKNTTGAQAAGIVGILFTTPEALEKNLKDMCILP